jgi:hypothetical protein
MFVVSLTYYIFEKVTQISKEISKENNKILYIITIQRNNSKLKKG